MSQHPSLRIDTVGAKHRNVLKRFERIRKLEELEKWQDRQSVFGLPKVKSVKVKVKKMKEVPAEGAATPEGTPAAGAAVPAAGVAKGGVKAAASAAKTAAPGSAKTAAAKPAAAKPAEKGKK